MDLSVVLVWSGKAVVVCLQMLSSHIHRSNQLPLRGTLYVAAACYPKMSETTLFHQK